MATQKKALIINGVERMFFCDPEHDSLADVIRRLGLTGTKIGCNVGQCGACSVILNGKLVRSCVRKIKNVDDYSQVFTIEGMGVADNLHPLQLSFMVHGALQCGFCTPGFIVSAKALLDSNPNPTRSEVREWFRKNRNACRCTGYKQIVDAVMDAARVLRGEKSMEELAWQLKDDNYYNAHLPRPSALGKVLGACEYGDDLAAKAPDDMLYLAVVMAGVSHANIKGIDCSEAEKAPGVVKVITYKDVTGPNNIINPIGMPRSLADGNEREILASTKVYQYGDIVALVAADSHHHAREAAKLVKVNIEELPAYMNALESLADDALEIHPGIPNLFVHQPLMKGEDPREIIEKAPYVAEGSFSTQVQSHLTIEPEVGQAYVDSDGVLTVHCQTHTIYIFRDVVAASLGLPKEKVRIVANVSGGSFGYAFCPHFPALLGAATLALGGRPVTLTFSYEEHMRYTGKRIPIFINARMAADENGKLIAGDFDAVYDKGAYSESSIIVRVPCRFFGWPYAIPNVRGLTKGVFSNHTFGTAYRGFGSPQAMTASESLMDILAEKIGMDPLEIRYLNCFREGDTTNVGSTLDVHPVPGLIEKLRPKYEALIERAKRESTPLKKRGVGVAIGSYVVGGPNDHAEVMLELNPDGSITNYNTWEDIGQGGDIGILVHTLEALKPLKIKPDQVKNVGNDSSLCPNSGIAAGSRSHFMVGNAIKDAAEKLLNAMRKPDGTFRTYDEMVAEEIPTKYLGIFHQGTKTVQIDVNDGHGDPSVDYSYAAYATEVEVDVTTGKTKVIAMHCIADVGVVGNYLAVDGQAFGGMEHSIGYALSENYADPKKHASLASAGFPYIDMIPDDDDFTVEYQQTERPLGPYGSGGASEAFQSGGYVSIINAIYNAVGVRIQSMPATPEKVKAALEAKEKGIELSQEKFYLGPDMYETLDEIKANPIVTTGTVIESGGH